MGWTCYSAWNSPKSRAEEGAEIVRIYTALVPEATCTAECLMASKAGSTWYLAIRLAPKPGMDIAASIIASYVPAGDGSITYAGVALTNRHRGEWGYKSMCETMGPCQADAPLALLSVLSPLAEGEGGYAGDVAPARPRRTREAADAAARPAGRAHRGR